MPLHVIGLADAHHLLSRTAATAATAAATAAAIAATAAVAVAESEPAMHHNALRPVNIMFIDKLKQPNRAPRVLCANIFIVKGALKQQISLQPRG